MKKLFTICAVAALILAFNRPTRAEWYIFEFSEEDLWYHTISSDTRLYNQDAPRRHHTTWKSNVQTTDVAQPNQNTYQDIAGTNGWYQTDTYDNWLSGGPFDNSDNAFGISQVQLWGAGWPNSLLPWNEGYRVNGGSGAWKILATPEGWTGEIRENPWPDNGDPNPLDQYYISWYANDYNQRILFDSAGDGTDDYIFRFAVDIFGEYPTTLEPTPDGNPFETDGSLRVWFGGNVLDPEDEWTLEGLDAVMELVPFDLGECISAQVEENCSGSHGKGRAECVKLQISFCHDLFSIPSEHASPHASP